MLSLLGGVIVGLVLAFAGAFFGYRFDTSRSTRQARIDAYKVLWSKSSALSMWPRNESLTYEDLERLRGEFRDWYFDEGGIYLSAYSRDRYNDVQETLTSFVSEFQPYSCSSSDYLIRWWQIRKRRELRNYRKQPRTGASYEGKKKSGVVSDTDYDLVRCALSELRTSLTRDLASRKGTFLGY